jgi:hypothetical protein
MSISSIHELVNNGRVHEENNGRFLPMPEGQGTPHQGVVSNVESINPYFNCQSLWL